MTHRKLARVNHIHVTHSQLVRKGFLPSSVVSMRILVDDGATVRDARDVFKKMEEEHRAVANMIVRDTHLPVNRRFTPPRVQGLGDQLVFVSLSTIQGGGLYVAPLMSEATKILREMGYDVSSSVEDWGLGGG